METYDKAREYAKKLAEIRKEFDKTEKQRLAPELSAQKRKELEDHSLSLRKAERELIVKIGKEIAAAIDKSSAPLKALSTRIKTSTKRMSRTTRTLDKVGTAVGSASRAPGTP
jgi:DNA replication protein DnaD